MINEYPNGVIAQLLQAILGQINFDGTPTSNIGDILLSILEQTPYDKEPKSVLAELFLKLKDKLEGRAFTPYDKEPKSAIAEILLSILNETEYDKEPNSRIAELLLELKAELESYAELTATGAIANFTTSVVKPLVNLTAYFKATQEAGTPTPQSPKAISGVSELNVFHCGKNLFNKNDTSSIIDGYIATSIVLSNNIKTVFTKCKPNTQYTVSKNAGERFTVGYTTELPTGGVEVFGRKSNNTGSNITITTGQNAVYIVAYIYNPSVDSGTAENMISSVQIEENTEATTYEAYNGVTTLINLGGTYYGGYVTQDKNGKRELVVTHNIVTLDGTQDIALVNWQPKTNTVGWLYPYALTNNKTVTASTLPNILCNKLEAEKYSQLYENDIEGVGVLSSTAYGLIVRIAEPTLTTKQAINDYLANNPIAVVYELAEPFTVALPDGEPITAFNGVNNVYNDSGDTSVTYLAKIADNLNSTAKLRAEVKAQKIRAKEELKEDVKELEPVIDSGETKRGA